MTCEQDELRRENLRLKSENLRLKLAAAVRHSCRLCGGVGAIPGFFLGTVKKCPACDGSGRQ